MLSRSSRILPLLASALAGAALAAGGGYAIAASGSRAKVIHGCVQVHTRLLEIKAKCGRGTQRITWNQQGPQGPVGPQGATGSAANSPITGGVNADGTAYIQGLRVQHIRAGAYQITVTAPQCQSHPFPTPMVTIENGSSAAQGGPYPVAYVQAGTVASGFVVYTGEVTNGTYAPTDSNFYVSVTC